MELKELLGDELYGQVEAKINEHNEGIEDKLQHVRYADLSEGNYVSREKYQTATSRAKGLEEQLSEANNTIKSYKDMDIEGIKKSATEWEEKYNTETQKLNQQIEADRKRFAAERFMDGQKIKSPLSRKAILQDFLAKGLNPWHLQTGKQVRRRSLSGKEVWQKQIQKVKENRKHGIWRI